MASIMALCSVVGASSAVMYWNRDPIKYNISLFTKMALNKYDDKLSPWWSKINDDIYIGAVPFDGQEKEIIKQIGTDGHVLSIMRKFENNYNGLFIKTVTPKKWEKLKIVQKQIESPDFLPLSQHKIIQAVEYIHNIVDINKKKIYVHCKAGHGRSVIAVICYFIKHRNMEVDEGIKFIKNKRPCININDDQKKCIVEYKNSLH